jgi:hypothetical protein
MTKEMNSEVFLWQYVGDLFLVKLTAWEMLRVLEPVRSLSTYVAVPWLCVAASIFLTMISQGHAESNEI